MARPTPSPPDGSGDGTLGLNLVDDDTIIDALTNKLGGTGTGNGNSTGETYTIDRTPLAAPASASIPGAVPRAASSARSHRRPVSSTTREGRRHGQRGLPGASVTGDAMVFSVTTPGSTPVTATVVSTPPSTSVSTTSGPQLPLDGAITMTVRTRTSPATFRPGPPARRRSSSRTLSPPLDRQLQQPAADSQSNPTITAQRSAEASSAPRRPTGGSPVARRSRPRRT